MIRAKAVILIEHDDAFLLSHCVEATTNKHWYIPLGGGVEFGGYSLSAAKREIREEISQETVDERLFDISENIFVFNGVKEHEIVFSYQARLKNTVCKETLAALANEQGKPIQLIWLTLQELIEVKEQVYPFSLVDSLLKII